MKKPSLPQLVVDPVTALVMIRISLGLYWLVHGLRLGYDLKRTPSSLAKSMGSLHPNNKVGAQLKNLIDSNNSVFAIIVPVLMTVSALSLTFGIAASLGGLLSVATCVSILVMNPTGAGSVRSLLLLIVLAIVLSFTQASSSFCIVPFKL